MAEKASPLNQLKQILLADNIHSISQLESKLDAFSLQWQNENWLIKTLNPVILNLISQKANEATQELANALAPVMGVAIKKQIETAREDIVDALHPVIGQLIRKSITEAMKNLIQSVNSQIEHAMSFELLLAKIKSKFTGTDNASLLLKQAAQVYQISQIFYIHKDTGILIAHASDQDVNQNDTDIIGGMLTAIRDFAKTAFSENENQELSEIQYGDFQILIENGRTAYLAVVLTGIFPFELKGKISTLENDLHKKYFQKLRNFDGDMSSFQDVKNVLDTFINHNKAIDPHRPQTSKGQSLKGLKSVLLLILFIFLIYFSIFTLPAWIEENRISEQLHELFENNSIIKAENVLFELDGTAVSLTGTVSNWQSRNEIEKLISQQPEITHVQNQIQVTHSDFDAEVLIGKVKTLFPAIFAEGQTDIHFIIDDSKLFLEGSVSSEEDRLLSAAAISNISEFPVVINNLKIKNETQSNLNEIENTILYFDAGQSVLIAENLAKIEKVNRILEFVTFDTLFISGHMDIEGPANVNKKLARLRADNVKQQFVIYGLPIQKISVLVKSQPNAVNEKQNNINKNYKRVSFSFK